MSVRHLRSAFFPLAAALSIACAPRATVSAPSTTDALPTRPDPSSSAPATTAHARWVPRVAPSFQTFGTQGLYGPANNNYGTAATTYLTKGRVGLVEGGRRFVFDRDPVPTAIGSDVTGKLERIVPVAAALGGGFIFMAKDGLFFAATFDGPLCLLSDHTNFFEVGPHVVLVPEDGLISTKTCKPVKTPERIGQMLTQSTSGFAIVATATTPPKTWLTTDGKTFKPITLDYVHQSTPDGDALLAKTDKGVRRVTRDGKVVASSITEQDFSLRSFQAMVDIPYPAADDGYPGAFIDAGFTPTGRTPDEWYTVRNHRILRTNTRTMETTAVGAPVGKADDSLCSPGILDGTPHLFCFELGKRIDISSVDVASGTTRPVYSFEAKSGVVSFMGAVANVFPKTQTIMASCDGDVTPGMMCIRDARGKWQTFHNPTPAGVIAPFPGELLTLAAQPDDSIELVNVGTNARRVFAAAEVARMRSETGETAPAKGKLPPVLNAGLLRTADGIRLFEGPNPFDPITKATSFAVDYSFHSSTLTITSVDGVVAVAGLHALRLSGGKLWETSDGWVTWYPVDPPPTGVPADLAGAMCRDEGCVLGPWSRLGWDR